MDEGVQRIIADFEIYSILRIWSAFNLVYGLQVETGPVKNRNTRDFIKFVDAP